MFYWSISAVMWMINTGTITVMMNLDILTLTMLWMVVISILFCMVSYQNINFLSNSIWYVLIILLMFCFSMSNFLLFYIFFECSLMPVLIMIMIMGIQPERISASFYFLIYTVFVSLPLLVLLLSVNLQFHFYMSNFQSSGLLILIIFPFLVKLPMFGAHFWLPKAHVEASISGSMVLAGLMLKLGGFGLIRTVMFFSNSFFYFFSMKSIYLILVFLSAFITLSQSDSKKMVAYSSIAHMTFVLVAAFMGMKLMWIAVIVSSLSHCWSSMGMFATAGLMSHFSGSRLTFVMQIKSFWSWLSLIFFSLICLNFSVPPLPSFFSEVVLFLSACSSMKDFWILIVVGFLFCYYNIKLFSLSSQNKVKFNSSNTNYCLESLTILSIFMMVIPSTLLLKMM